VNCGRIEELLPLYVGADLPEAEMTAVADHLAGCNRCSGLAADLNESASWFRGAETPVFDDSEMHRLRSAVNRRIDDEIAAPGLPGLMDRIIALLGWRPALVATAGAIFLLAVLLYSFRSGSEPRPAVTPDIVRKAEIRDVDESPKPDRPQAEPVRRKRPRKRAANRRTNLVARTWPKTDLSASRPTEPLRIEMQTADPNIRIIWLAQASPGR